MEGARYGKWCGLWITAEEAAETMLQVTEDGAKPVMAKSVSEGDVLQGKMNPSLVFEVFLYDHVRDTVFLTEV